MDDKQFAQLRRDLADKYRLIAELNAEAAEMERQVQEELERRKDWPGNVTHFRPRPSNGPTDQGSC